VIGLMLGCGRFVTAQSFAVVVHKSSPVTNLRFADLRAIFSGASPHWTQGGGMVLVERDNGSLAFRFLLNRVLNTTASEYKRTLARIDFAGGTPPNIKILNTEGAACKFVFNVPGSIAVIESDSLAMPECQQIQIVRIDGRLPAEEGYRLR